MQSLKKIAALQGDFPAKFGIPRQSSLVPGLKSTVVFEPEYRNPETLRGLEAFSHLWLIWGFSEVRQDAWSPTVRPPRLGGNARMGVFATRSPFRPNPIGLSCVQLERIENHPRLGPVIHVLGADLMHGTPIYDIKPYLPYADSHPEAIGGFANDAPGPSLQVVIPKEWLAVLPHEKGKALAQVLALDPRPSYQADPARVYGMEFAGFNVRFTVQKDILQVLEIKEVGTA